MRVFNSIGVLVMQKQITDNNINMEVGHWPPGMYYLQLSTEKASGVRGFVIQH
ncbi:MAG: T9SS type A sorting domain-containing protein [Bacteroidota bacterium]